MSGASTVPPSEGAKPYCTTLFSSGGEHWECLDDAVIVAKDRDGEMEPRCARHADQATGTFVEDWDA